jgi:hypothetical protein
LLTLAAGFALRRRSHSPTRHQGRAIAIPAALAATPFS